MMTYEMAVQFVRTNMSKQTTVDEAKDSLRKCGILDDNNQIKDVYREFIVEKVITRRKKNGRK